MCLIVCASKREYVRVEHRGWVKGLGRVTRSRMWVLAVSVFTAAACAASSGTGATPGPSAAAAIDLDGRFHAAPVSNQNPTIPGSRALEVLSLQYNRGVTSYRPPLLAWVTWSAQTAQSPLGSVPVRQGAAAWVLVFTEVSAAPTCPFGATAQPVPSGVGPGSNAVIVDARTGAAAIYQGGSPGCGGLSTPTISAAGRYWSVPWTPAPDGQFAKVTVPACGVLAGSAQVNEALYLVAETPLDGPCSGPSRTVVSDGPVLAYNTHGTHGPNGPLCADYLHVQYPLPPVPGCVLGRYPPRP